MIDVSASQQTPSLSPLVFNGTATTLGDSAEFESSVTRQDGWLVSFIDILILLVTLFVLLLAYQEEATEEIRQHKVDTLPVASAAEAESHATAIALPLLQSAPDSTAAFFSIKEELPASPLNEIDSDSVRAMDPLAATELSGPNNPAPPHADDTYLNGQSLKVSDSNNTASASLESREEQTTSVATSADNRLTPGQAMEDFLDLLRDSDLQNRVEVRTHGAGVHLEISDSIVFSPASAALTPDGIALLEQLAEALETEAYQLSVEGHSDNIPIATAHFPSNWELSTARAATVARHLIKRGIPAERIRAIGYADTRPRADNLTQQGRSRNRRVSLILQNLSAHR